MIFYKFTNLLQLISLFTVVFATQVACQPHQTTPKQKLLELHNQARANNISCQSSNQPTTTKLVWNSQLEQVAHQHSYEMSTRRQMSHLDGSNNYAGERLTSAGYNWKSFAENIAYGANSDVDVFELWINSQSHCENIINPAYTEMGAAQVDGYWTAVYATPE